MMDVRYDEIDDLDRARRLPSLQLIGTPERATIDLNALRAAGSSLSASWSPFDGAQGEILGLAGELLRARRPQDEPAAREHRRLG